MLEKKFYEQKKKHTLSEFFSIEEENYQSIKIIRLEGVIYIPEAEEFERFMKSLDTDGFNRVIMNFRQVKQVPSLVFATIIQTYKRCHEKNGTLFLCSVPKALMRVFITMQFDKIFRIYDTEEEALLHQLNAIEDSCKG